MRPRMCAVLALVLIVGGMADCALAQDYIGRAASQRPSSYAPSQTMGGIFTSNRNFASLQATYRDVALLGGETFQFSRTNRVAGRGRELNVVRLGMYNTLSAPGGLPLSSAVDRTGDVNLLPEMRDSGSLRLDLTPFGGGRLPAINSFLYTPMAPRTAFHEAFGLTPTQSGSSERRIRSVADELERQTAGIAQRALERGMELFREASAEQRDPRTNVYPNCPECPDKLAGAIAQLTTARDLDSQVWLAPLLLAHAAMEQEKPSVAFVELAEAFRRKPDLFSGDPVDLSKYFGDVSGGRSLYLTAQLQRYLRVGDLNPTSSEAQLLQAYCAWQSGDRPRAREAAGLAGRLEQRSTAEDKFLHEKIILMASAVEAAAP